MKTIILDSKAAAKAYLTRPPEDTHTKEELESLHACIRYTQQFKHEESMAKMDEESPIDLPLPDIGNFGPRLPIVNKKVPFKIDFNKMFKR
jgi:hypothetical protein